MEMVYLLIPLVLLLVCVAVGAFLWALRSGQFDDLETPAVRAMFDEDGEQDKAERN